MTASEHMYVLSAAQSEQHTDEVKLEIDADDLKDFRKRFKAVRKKIRKQLYGK
jgi:L-alanine-DL-glutamate epimerase-like enolase superfamily enzyme